MTLKRVGAYLGIDPTAKSLHVGHLVPLMSLFWLYVNGCHAVSLVRLLNHPYEQGAHSIFSSEAQRQSMETQSTGWLRDRSNVLRFVKPIWPVCICS